MIPVMYDDGYEASHPVIADIKNPNEIASLFDSITYDKGCSLLFMLESTVTEAVFQNGLVVRLKIHVRSLNLELILLNF
jgi:aminopeptidase N